MGLIRGESIFLLGFFFLDSRAPAPRNGNTHQACSKQEDRRRLRDGGSWSSTRCTPGALNRLTVEGCQLGRTAGPRETEKGHIEDPSTTRLECGKPIIGVERYRPVTNRTPPQNTWFQMRLGVPAVIPGTSIVKLLRAAAELGEFWTIIRRLECEPPQVVNETSTAAQVPKGLVQTQSAATGAGRAIVGQEPSRKALHQSFAFQNPLSGLLSRPKHFEPVKGDDAKYHRKNHTL